MKNARLTGAFFVIGLLVSLLVFIRGHGNASQDSSASGGLKLLSGINRAGLDKIQETSSWGRNPFYFPREGQGRPTGSDASGLQLSAIFYHEKGSVAIINHRIVRQGDQIEGRKVFSISENRVILEDLSGVLELKLDPFGLQ